MEVTKEFLRHLVDCTWNHVTESTEVPATKTADMIIENAQASFIEIKKNQLAERIDHKVIEAKKEELAKYTKNSIFEEYYSHTRCDMYKILNEHTKFNEDKWVLSPVSEGLEQALDLAIKSFIKQKNDNNR